MKQPLYLHALGLAADGMAHWKAAANVLCGDAAPGAEFAFPAAEGLPRNERRRATRITRLAFAACRDALGTERPAVRSVFASCSGDLDTLDAICRQLAAPEVALSPLQFHNSVHNATAGYWTIAGGINAASTSLSAFDGTFAAGLLEAAAQALETPGEPVMLVAYDLPVPALLRPSRPVHTAFAVAMLLGTEMPSGGAMQYGTRPPASLWLTPSISGSESRMDDPYLEVVRQNNPAARCLPLLRLLAGRQDGTVRLPAAPGMLDVTVKAAA